MTAFSVMAALLILGVVLYIFARTYVKAWRLGVEMSRQAFDQILGRSVPALVGMAIAAVVIAVVSLLFQTMTESKVLTPSMIGFDAVFIGVQTMLLFFFGSTSVLFQNSYVNFLISAGAMVVISLLMYSAILRKSKNNMIFLLMFGLVLSGIVGNGARYLQTIMTNYEFFQLQAAIHVTVNNMNTSIIFLVLPIMVLLIVVILARHRTYNVLILGGAQAKGLGVAYEKELHRNLILVAIGMSVATALIGSLTFLGLLAVNLARMLLKTHRHLPLFIGSAVIAALALIMGQGVVELLEGAIPVTVIINLIGCSYLFYFILKENKKF